MTFKGGLGYALISLGPALALFFTGIVRKPFLVLTLLVSTLSWLTSLILIASVWRFFLPGESSVWIFIPLILSAVGVQEAARLLFWRIYTRVEEILNKLAVKLSKPRLHSVDKFEIALAFGLGHGVAHVVFFCLAMLTPSFGPATFYVSTCSQMPFFMMSALTALGFLLIHTFSMIVAFNGHAEGIKSQQLFAPGIHLVASLLTVTNLLQGGCVFGVSSTLTCAFFTAIVCWKIEWDKTGPNAVPLSITHRTHH